VSKKISVRLGGKGCEMSGLLTTFLKVGGVTALTIGIFFLLYKQLLALRIFSKLGGTQTFLLVSLIAVLVWITAMTALVRTDKGVSPSYSVIVTR
jgi:hypothetical protein